LPSENNSWDKFLGGNEGEEKSGAAKELNCLEISRGSISLKHY